VVTRVFLSRISLRKLISAVGRICIMLLSILSLACKIGTTSGLGIDSWILMVGSTGVVTVVGWIWIFWVVL